MATFAKKLHIMSEMVIRSTNIEALQKLAELVRLFGLEVVITKDNSPVADTKQWPHLPIQFAAKPDVLALAGIWKNRKIDLQQIVSLQEQLRQSAWGGRA